MRKVTGNENFSEFTLDKSILTRLKGSELTAAQMIHAVRFHLPMKIKGIGPVKEEKIYNAVDAAGYIFHESTRAAAVRALWSAIECFSVVQSSGVYNENVWIRGSKEAYESQVPMSEEQVEEVKEILDYHLKSWEVKVLTLRFGLEDGHRRNLSQVAKEIVLGDGERKALFQYLSRNFPDFDGSMTARHIRCVEARALRTLRSRVVHEELKERGILTDFYQAMKCWSA